MKAKKNSVDAAPLGHRAQICRVALNLGQRNFGRDNTIAARLFHTLHLNATGIQVPQDVTHELFGHCHHNTVDRLQEDMPSLGHGIMVGVVIEHGAKVDRGIPCEDPLGHDLTDALFDRRDKGIEYNQN